jgi:predicted transcriptional regulator
MTKKRTRLEVIRDILEILKKGDHTKITHLIYKSNLSNNSIKPYLEELMQNQLIGEMTEKEKKYFIITQKGREFLEEFNKIKIFSEAYGLG